MQQNQKQVVLKNGEPKLCIQKMTNGAYRWVTSKTGIMTHSLLSEAVAFMEEKGYDFYINETPKSYDD
jgi:hypothetical protein